ncbi:MAG: sulfotransferase [Mizugakiibacter sp.]|uniref:tetratricopeptide repeat-containing sulfotransferase family protein n=1 Tax=Mizugakiibacter sp. TaxID=1972610 RepID=UPI0031C949AF|nr:sulfotransferase [Xanthomonadaceae bacterium]
MNAAAPLVPDALLADFHALAPRDAAAAFRALVGRLEAARAPAPAWERVVAGLIGGGFAVAATALAERGLAFHPHNAGLRYLLGNALRLQGERVAAERELRAALAAQPQHGDAALSLAHLLREQGRLNGAAAAVQIRWKHAPRTRDEALGAATFLKECQHHAEALEVCTEALKQVGDAAALHALTGELALALGRFEQARVQLRRAVEMDPTQASSWLRLAAAHKFRNRDDVDLVLLERAAAQGLANADARVCVGFALGKAYADLGDVPAAAGALREANAAMAARAGWSSKLWQNFVERQVRAAPLAPVAVPDIVPVFVVGLPRTGTTLVATLLGKHPQVRNRGELNWLAALAAHVEGQRWSPASLAQSAALFAAQLRQDDVSARCYIDKNPLNFRHLGLAAALFPNARVIHCRRNRRDTALSIWSQHFAHADNGYAYRFEDIAAFAQGHDRLMTHWRATLPLPVYDLSYEKLVARPDETVADLLRFLSLEAPLAPAPVEARPQAIATASVWQARQQVYSSSVGRWRAWADHLPELLDAFPNERAS